MVDYFYCHDRTLFRGSIHIDENKCENDVGDIFRKFNWTFTFKRYNSFSPSLQ